MKQRILGILTVALAFSLIFAMAGCKDTSSPSKKKSAATVDVSFNANGWSVADDIPANRTKVEVGTKITLPKLEDNGTQVFLGWATSGDGAGGYGAAGIASLVATAAGGEYTTIEGENPTFYVIWEEDATPVEAGKIRVYFYLNYDGAPAFPNANGYLDIDEDTSFGAAFPANPTRTDYFFQGWYNRVGTTEPVVLGDVEYDKDYIFFVNPTRIYAKWEEDKLTIDPVADAGAEVVFVENGSYVLYQFDIPAGKQLSDYNKVSYKVKISSAAKAIIEAGHLRHARLMGAYTAAATVGTDTNGTKYIGLSEYNAPYIINTGYTATTVNSTVETANEWYTLEFDLSGSAHAQFAAANGAGTIKGTVYFGVGISGNYNVNGAGDNDPSHRYIQLIKDVTLQNANATTTAIVGKKPAESIPVFPNPVIPAPQFVSYCDPIIFSWRAEATQDNIDNWRDKLPQPPTVEVFDRGAAPALGSLARVDLGTFTYENRNNPNNQKGWVSFEEAGRANDQNASVTSVIQFQNFNKAWYLELTATDVPTGTVSLVWMGGYGGFNSQAATNNTGVAITDISEIIDNEDGTYTIRFFLPKALTNYGAYYNENSPWAALALGYWGASNHNINDLNITKAELLIDPADKVGDAQGLAFGYTFALSNPPTGGNIIDDVELDAVGTTLTIKAVSALTSDIQWYVDGTKNAETSGTLALTVTSGEKLVIVLQGKKADGNWVSQSVYITLKNN